MAVARAGYCELDALCWTRRNHTAPDIDGDDKSWLYRYGSPRAGLSELIIIGKTVCLSDRYKGNVIILSWALFMLHSQEQEPPGLLGINHL